MLQTVYQYCRGDGNGKGTDDRFCDGRIIAVGVEGIDPSHLPIFEKKKRQSNEDNGGFNDQKQPCKALFSFGCSGFQGFIPFCVNFYAFSKK